MVRSFRLPGVATDVDTICETLADMAEVEIAAGTVADHPSVIA